ncbi:acyl-CoA dehydrogenase family protein [Nocardia caishijiensis]|uniref:Alkylation response protein AidB-like acyl-CoA dehydrogenase n=1 Tax=Nocardia caishijiensis TaxID=184756 RepID=A0ABQ6YQK7_9NOCA|nr:acyl-CoA dehydrogenase family protein [Nocardia caishijiensis]KAF0847938.1 alkylation response protein AidB-like acyl-CoA dehydrogenase [Nocardia caishijiensis]
MDFTPTEAQTDLARLTGEVCAKLVTADRLRELDTPGRFDEQLWKALGETGVLAAALPESLGGSDFGELEQSAVLRELGRVVAAVPYLWSIVLGAGALARFGDEGQGVLAQRAGAGELVLTAALSSSLHDPMGAPGITATPASADNATAADPMGGSSVGTVTTAADSDTASAAISVSAGSALGRTGPAWVLSGVATTVPYADRAERILVPASLSGEASAPVAVFLVDPANAVVRPQQVVDLSPEFLVEFADTPAELLGTVESGADILTWLRERAWLGLSALQLGTLERALDITAEHTRTREQFGKAIGSFQSVAQRLADAYIDIGGLRLTVTQAAWRLSEGLPATEAVHIAKFWAAEAGHKVAHTVVHVHGGLGIDRDHITHNYFTAAKHHEFALGAATGHLLALGAELAR